MVLSIISLACLVVLVIVAVSAWRKNDDVLQAVNGLSSKLESKLKAESVEKPAPVDIDLNYIAELVRREGYVPNIDNENNAVFFKVYGEYVGAAYTEGRFVMSKKYGLDPETNMQLMGQAARMAEAEMFLLKIYVHTDENGENGIVFEAPLLISSAEELAKYFLPCLQIVHGGIDSHRKHFDELSKECVVPEQEQENSEKVTKILS